MDIRYGANRKDCEGYDTRRLRDEFLIEELFLPDRVTHTYTHIDRMLLMGAMPVKGSLSPEDGIDCRREVGVGFLLERRELGVINVGGTGTVDVDGAAYCLSNLDCLYVGRGAREVRLSSGSPEAPAKFYMVSLPSGGNYPTKLIKRDEAINAHLGEAAASNIRTIHKYIHPDIVETSQLTMGCTILESGSVWNSMPCHIHERRMEAYMYFGMAPEDVVFHFMGAADETRHIVVHSEQAVISPSWSAHFGCGTASYGFVWAMGGENRDFSDVNGISNSELK